MPEILTSFFPVEAMKVVEDVIVLVLIIKNCKSHQVLIMPKVLYIEVSFKSRSYLIIQVSYLPHKVQYFIS